MQRLSSHDRLGRLPTKDTDEERKKKASLLKHQKRNLPIHDRHASALNL